MKRLEIKRTHPENPDFISLIELLNLELWERNEDRQQVYVSHNILEKGTKCLVAYVNGVAVASGAIRMLDNKRVEIKRMFVIREYRGKGYSKEILNELEIWSKELGYSEFVLETGINHPEAISLYEKSGYRRIKNYGPYKNLPESICMGKIL